MRPSSVRQCRCPHGAHTSNNFVRQCIVLASKSQVAQPFAPVIFKGNISLQVLSTTGEHRSQQNEVIGISYTHTHNPNYCTEAARTRQLQGISGHPMPMPWSITQAQVVHGQCCRAGTSATWKDNNRDPCDRSAERGSTSKQISGMVTPITRAAQDKLMAPVCSCDRVRQ